MDDVDREQHCQELELSALIAHARRGGEGTASLLFCQECGDALPEARRRLLPGVTLCVDCQSEKERPGAGR